MRYLCDTSASQLFPGAVLRVAAVGDAGDDGGLGAVDDLLATCARQQEEQAAHARALLLEQHRFAHSAACMFERFVRPAFQDIAKRLNSHGGSGFVEERPRAGRRGQRLTLWMSLGGPVLVSPSVDRNSYIQLAVDVAWRRVTVWEGDVWHMLEASRRIEPLTLVELTTESVTQRTVDVLCRTVNHGDLSKVVAQ